MRTDPPPLSSLLVILDAARDLLVVPEVLDAPPGKRAGAFFQLFEVAAHQAEVLGDPLGLGPGDAGPVLLRLAARQVAADSRRRAAGEDPTLMPVSDLVQAALRLPRSTIGDLVEQVDSTAQLDLRTEAMLALLAPVYELLDALYARPSILAPLEAFQRIAELAHTTAVALGQALPAEPAAEAARIPQLFGFLLRLAAALFEPPPPETEEGGLDAYMTDWWSSVTRLAGESFGYVTKLLATPTVSPASAASAP